MTKEDPRKIMVNGPVEPSEQEASSVEPPKKDDNKLMHEKVILPISEKSSDKQSTTNTSNIKDLPGEIKFTEDKVDNVDAPKIKPKTEPSHKDETVAEPAAKSDTEPVDDNAKKQSTTTKAEQPDDVAQPVDTSVPDQEVEDTKDTASSDKQEDEVDPSFEPVWRKHQAVPTHKKSKKKIFKLILIVIIIGFIAACIYPASRYWLLQKSTLKKSFEVTFTDKKTGEPVSNLQVTINNNQQTTDEYGHAYFNDIRLGKYNLNASRPGFAPTTQNIILEPWTHYNLPNQKLQVIGVRFQLQAVDWLSGKPIADVEAKYNSSAAKSNQVGKLTVVTPPLHNGKAKVTVSADGYHSQTITLHTNKTDTNLVKLVPSQLDYFMSNRDGKYGVYSSWLNGTHQTQILSGTGNEKADTTQFIIAPNNKYAALITTRNNIQDPTYSSQSLNELFILNLQNSQLTKVTNGPIVGVGWVNNNFIYQVTDAKKSYKAKDATKLISIDSNTAKQTTLATSNSFANSTNIINGQIYYSPNDSYNNSSQAFFSKINPDGSDKQQLITDKIINQISRLSYSQLQLQAQDGSVINYEASNNKSSSTTRSNTNNIYSVSPNNKNYVWVEQRDGKSALIMQTSKKQKVLYQAVGISDPIHWLDNNTIVFMVNNDNGVSDYALSLNGGKPQKISDISNLGVY